jgi:hypothetical protein
MSTLSLQEENQTQLTFGAEVPGNTATVTYTLGHSGDRQAGRCAIDWYENREAASELKLANIPLGVDALLVGEKFESFGFGNN